MAAPVPALILPQEVVAGTLAGWAQVVVGHPFDTVKVQLQTNSKQYRNGVDCFKIIAKNEAFLGFYRGVASPLMGIGACNAVLFSTYSNFRRLIRGGDTTRPLSLRETGMAGALTGSVMAFFNTPVELLKVQLQTQKNNPAYKGVFDAAAKIYAHRGISGLYHGLPITIMRDIPSFATYFFVYEGIKQIIGNHNHNGNKNHLSSTELLFSGGIAGIACWIPCYPQDVIKSTMQSNLNFKSARECFWSLLSYSKKTNTSVFRLLSNGFGPTMVRAFPANAATFFAYEMALKILRVSD
ncbi:mitochondrial carrier domain-containing protein [Gigaspora rosea]|uniref:Mitochondrial carrier domain-containing protein n=1 Tax=Gigaspora rosea TaxID=44941 RepID=A0A397UDV6_9GLOM|nr:mitochondrial carrier domain-containing protein [Gigaspora rosea]